MATIGFQEVHFAVLDDNEQVTETFVVNAKKGGAINMKFSGLSPQNNVVYASDGPFHIASSGTSSPKAEIGIADLPPELEEAISGATKNADGIVTVGKNTTPPYVAVFGKTKGLKGDDIYMGLTKAKFGLPDGAELSTTEDKGPEVNTDTLSGEGVDRGLDDVAFAKGRTADTDFTYEKYRQFMFPGEVVTPATPTP